MTKPDNPAAGTGGGQRTRRGTAARPRPQWADGLRKLYDSVVEEPLPDDLMALLARLDSDDQQGSR